MLKSVDALQKLNSTSPTLHHTSMNDIPGRKKTPTMKKRISKRKSVRVDKSNISGNEISDIAAASLELQSPKLTIFADEDWL